MGGVCECSPLWRWNEVSESNKHGERPSANWPSEVLGTQYYSPVPVEVS